ncbi:MAG: hypothetical protein IT307_07605, partial [Chloroflexi bacterium]|nr:hypothetical protein [Chloroflexota bacterium]
MKRSRFWRIAGGTILSMAVIWGCQRAGLPTSPSSAGGGNVGPPATEMQSSFAEAGSQPTFTPRPVATTTLTGLKVE